MDEDDEAELLALADEEALALALAWAFALADGLADEATADADSLALADCSWPATSLAASVAFDEHPASTSAETLAAPAAAIANLILRDPDADPIIDFPSTAVTTSTS